MDKATTPATYSEIGIAMPDVSQLLPQRPPFLMVESVLDYGGEDNPTLVAAYTVRGSDTLFAAPRPPTHWPSVHVIEGLGQSCQVLSVLQQSDPCTVGGAPGDTAAARAPNIGPLGFLAAVDVEIHGFAKPGDSLRYRVTQTHALDELYRFSVAAFLKERMIASGAIVAAMR